MENLNYIIGIIAGVITIAGFIAGIRYFRPKSILQKIFQFGFGNSAKNNITDKDTKED